MSDSTCRLYLICPTPLPPGFETILAAALAGGDVAAIRVTAPGADDAAGLATLTGLQRVAHAQGVAVILDGAAETAVRAGSDGAHIVAGADVAAARRILGDRQLGVWCGGSRDQAMDAGQDGADYVSFGPFFGAEDAAEPELISWWVELMELPAVAEGCIDLDNCSPLLQAGVDFLAVGDAVWQHAGGPAEAVRAFNQAIRAHAPGS